MHQVLLSWFLKTRSSLISLFEKVRSKGIFHILINFWFSHVISPFKLTTKIPSAVDSKVAFNNEIAWFVLNSFCFRSVILLNIESRQGSLFSISKKELEIPSQIIFSFHNVTSYSKYEFFLVFSNRS